MTTPMDDGVMRLHDALIEIGSETVPDPEWSWARMSTALPDRRVGLAGRLGAWLRRPLILSFASLVMGTGGAYAAGFEPARQGVDWVLNQLPGVSIEHDRRSENDMRGYVADDATGDSDPNETNNDRGGSNVGLDDDGQRDGRDQDRDDGDDDDGADGDGDDGRGGDDGDRDDDGEDRGDDDDGEDDDDGDDDDGASGSGSSGGGSGDDDREEEVDPDDDRDADDEIELPDADDIDDEDD